jgi:hypothetical protein
MSDASGFSSEFAQLDDLSAAAYGRAVRQGAFDTEEIAACLGLTMEQAARAERVLRMMRLLQPMPGNPEVLVPIAPDVAAAELVSPAENQIRDLQQAVVGVRGKLLSLRSVYFEGRRARNQFEALDVVEDVAQIRSLVSDLGRSCRSEFWAVQPGGSRPAEVIKPATQAALKMLARGVQLRGIYQHTVRTDLVTSSYVRAVTAAGAEIRTTAEVIDRMLMYDREIVVIPKHGTGDDPAAVVIREPTLVALLCAVFEHQWDNSQPFAPDSAKAVSLPDDIEDSIIRLMALGYKDEMVARRLGMSVRTCRRHIAEITEALGATSRFQAGFNAALAKRYHGDAPAGEADEGTAPRD